jgi:2-polyprenyl-3-methyl-5-hydroxy-6-metoxy-1,4-benzoquinol methylase
VGTAPKTEKEAGVPSGTYSREYFLTECDGHEEYQQGRLPSRLHAALSLAGDLAGKRVLDVGCGRGEVVLYCLRQGAEACGVDYSADALLLARQGAGDEPGHYQRADARQLPFQSGTFDVALMLDIVEHLYPAELAQALADVHRVLKPGGILIVHTMPNLWYYRFGYPLFRWVQRLRGKDLPRDPRARWQFVSAVHVNEQTPLTLRRALKEAGFTARVWLQPTQSYSAERSALVRGVMRFLATTYPFRWVFCDDIFALATKSK